MVTNKKFYIAGRTTQLSVIKKLVKDLADIGYKSTAHWIEAPSYAPYEQNRVESIRFSKSVIKDIQQADIFVLIWDESLYGALIELGIFLGKAEKQQKIFIIGPKERVCVFEMLPHFICLNSTHELLTYLSGN